MIVVLVRIPLLLLNIVLKQLPLAFISDSDVQNAIKRLRLTKSVELDGIPNFSTSSQIYF
jgi:hypothetical protein